MRSWVLLAIGERPRPRDPGRLRVLHGKPCFAAPPRLPATQPPKRAPSSSSPQPIQRHTRDRGLCARAPEAIIPNDFHKEYTLGRKLGEGTLRQVAMMLSMTRSPQNPHRARHALAPPLQPRQQLLWPLRPRLASALIVTNQSRISTSLFLSPHRPLGQPILRCSASSGLESLGLLVAGRSSTRHDAIPRLWRRPRGTRTRALVAVAA